MDIDNNNTNRYLGSTSTNNSRNNIINHDNRTFSAKFNYYTSRLLNTHRFIEITKCCGYCEIHPLLKNASLTDLYSEVRRIFECHTKCELYIRIADPELKNLACRCDDSFILRHIDPLDTKNSFIQLMVEYNIQPVYLLPDPVVYQIFLDDGHRHDDHKCMFDA